MVHFNYCLGGGGTDHLDCPRGSGTNYLICLEV